MFWAKALQFVFDNPLGKLAAAAVLMTALIGGFAWEQRRIGARAVVTTLEKSADDKLKAAGAKQRGLDPDGAAERLRQQYCRDC